MLIPDLYNFLLKVHRVPDVNEAVVLLWAARRNGVFMEQDLQLGFKVEKYLKKLVKDSKLIKVGEAYMISSAGHLAVRDIHVLFLT